MGKADALTLRQWVAGLPSQLPDDLEPAKQFDLLILNLQLAMLHDQTRGAAALRDWIVAAAGLLQDTNIPMVQARRAVLLRVQTDEYWADVTLPTLEDLRRELRDIVGFIERDSRAVIHTDFEDVLNEPREGYVPGTLGGINREQYRKKVEQFIRQRQDTGVVRKIRLGQALHAQDLADLEALFNDTALQPHDRFLEIYGPEMNLAAFVRSLVGLDRKEAEKRFEAFLDRSKWTSDQITFVRYIIDHLARNGTIAIDTLYEPPFINVHQYGLTGIFSEAQAGELLAVIRGVNESVIAVN